MGKAQIFTGARAILFIGETQVGMFSQCSWSIRQGKEPAFILGRYSPAEITPTTQEAVHINLTGYRMVKAGPYKVAKATLLNALLDEEDFIVKIQDRQTKAYIFTASGCRCTGWSSGVSARGVSDIRIDLVGMKGEDEFATDSGRQGDDEAASAAKLDDGA